MVEGGDEDQGQDSEQEEEAIDPASDVVAIKGPLGESVIDGPQDVAMLVAAGAAEFLYDGPTARQLARWKRRGSRW